MHSGKLSGNHIKRVLGLVLKLHSIVVVEFTPTEFQCHQKFPILNSLVLAAVVHMALLIDKLSAEFY